MPSSLSPSPLHHLMPGNGDRKGLKWRSWAEKGMRRRRLQQRKGKLFDGTDNYATLSSYNNAKTYLFRGNPKRRVCGTTREKMRDYTITLPFVITSLCQNQGQWLKIKNALNILKLFLEKSSEYLIDCCHYFPFGKIAQVISSGIKK